MKVQHICILCFLPPELIFPWAYLNLNEVPFAMKARDINRCKNVNTNLYPVLPCLHLTAICVFLHICTFEKFSYKGNLGKKSDIAFCLLPLPKGNSHHSASVGACVRALSNTEPIDDLHEICYEPYDTGSHPNILLTNNIAGTGTCEMEATAAPFHIGPMNNL
jgi:hypothetical protein